MALYRNEVKWIWRFGIGWPLFILVGLLVTGAIRPVTGMSFIDRYEHVAIVLAAMVGMIMPIFVVMARHARVMLKHGDEHRWIMIASDIGGVIGMLSLAGALQLIDQSTEWIHPLLPLAVLPVLNCALALLGTIIGEHTGLRLTRSSG